MKAAVHSVDEMRDKLIEILLVEDNPADARLVEEMLTDAKRVQFRLTHVDMLGKALESLRHDNFDIVLLDLTLPDGHGLDTLTRSRTAAAGIPIVVMSGLRDEKLAIKALQAGAQDYLVKDFVNSELLIRSMLYAIERKYTEEDLRKARDELEMRVKERTAELRRSADQLRRLSSRLMAAQETERRRISRELHDELGQALTLLKLRLRFVEENLRADQVIVRKECEDAIMYIDQVIENVRRLSQDLSPSILEDLGLTAALVKLIDNFMKSEHINITYDITDIDQLVPQDARIGIYRVIQEALTNIWKHAEAEDVLVAVKKDGDRISFFIEDNGKGFNIKSALKSNASERGLGLASMDERVRLLGGTFNLWSKKGEGTRITFSIPVKKGKSP